jgi:hypothetical protein
MLSASERMGAGTARVQLPIRRGLAAQRARPGHLGVMWQVPNTVTAAAGSSGVPASSDADNVQKRKRIVPDVPFLGDDQGSTIYTALFKSRGTFDESQPAEGVRSSSSSSSSNGAVAAAGSNGSLAQAEDGGIPHRWRVVGMMALSFVLCNMDKVRGFSRNVKHTCISVSAAALWRMCVHLQHGPSLSMLPPPSCTQRASLQPLPDYSPFVLLPAGQHVCGCHPHGEGAWLDSH